MTPLKPRIELAEALINPQLFGGVLKAPTWREKALDPIASPDAAEAEKVVWAAELNRD
jgi:hypothetical protein